MTERVQVVVRCRPLNERETKISTNSVISVEDENSVIELADPSSPSSDPRRFTFDGAYGPSISTGTIYDSLIYPLIEEVLNGFNATIFAYGQTGCGKSFTMEGPEHPPDQLGIIPRAFEQLFESMSVSKDAKFLVYASYLEIYNENLFDLLEFRSTKLDIAEHPQKGVYVTNISRHQINSVEKCKKLMSVGRRNRVIGETQMNRDSSRSHAIFIIDVEASVIGEFGKEKIIAGKLNLVDLAGSERQSKTETTGIRFKEAIKINLSLSALGNVISSLVDGKRTHIPYRDSKLTRLLQNSLGGNSKTMMIACISPSSDSFHETLSTLRYANRAKNIKNAPKINEDPRDAMLRQYKEEISRLRNNLDKNYEEILAEHSSKLHLEYSREIENLKAQFEKEKQIWMERSNDDLTVKYDETNKEIIQNRLIELESGLVGGEEIDNEKLNAVHQKRKKLAKKVKKPAEVSIGESEDDLIMSMYQDIHNKVVNTSVLYENECKKVKVLKRELQDTKEEFAETRENYLEYIREQQKQIEYLNSFIEKIHFCIPKESNYSNLDKVKSKSSWDEGCNHWTLPQFHVENLSLPNVNLNSKNDYPRRSSNRKESTLLNLDTVNRSFSLTDEQKAVEHEQLQRRPFRLNPLEK